MFRRNLATTICVILSALTFITVGSCFSAFLYKREIVKVENPQIILADGVKVYNLDDKEVNSLELSTMKLGLKPATGEEDSVSNIPSTVTDEQGTEGVYAKFKIQSSHDVKIVIKNIKIETKEDQEKVDKERKNICVAIKELEGGAVSLEKDQAVLGNISASSEMKEYTFLVWLCGKAGDDLEGSTISFDLNFEKI